MRILFAAKTQSHIVWGSTRAPDQARKRLEELFAGRCEILWVALAGSVIAAPDLLQACASRTGQVSRLANRHLGELLIVPVNWHKVDYPRRYAEGAVAAAKADQFPMRK